MHTASYEQEKCVLDYYLGTTIFFKCLASKKSWGVTSFSPFVEYGQHVKYIMIVLLLR